jgi:hypothetical protein
LKHATAICLARRFTLALGFLFALAAAPRAAHAQIFPSPILSWDDFTVDFPGVGQISSVGVDSAGRAQIAYRDTLNGDLKYGRKNNNNSWQVFVVESSGEAGSGVSLAVDSAGNPHIAYFRSASVTALGDLKYAKGTCTPNGQSWTCSFAKTTIETGIHDTFSAGNTSIALDGTGVPHIAYFDNTHDQLKWARKLSGVWDTANVTATAGGIVSMVTDENNFPQMVFGDSASNQIKYVRIFCAFIFCGWTFEDVDTGLTPTMKRAADGRVHVAYARSGMTRYALRTCSGSTCSWTLQAVGPSGNAFFPGLALNSAGSPFITFVRSPFSELMYANRTFFGWNTQVADVDVSDTGNTSIVIDSTDHRHISYPGRSDQSLRHVKGTLPPPPVLQQATFSVAP